MYRDRQIIIETFDYSQSDKLDWIGLESSWFVCHTKQIIVWHWVEISQLGVFCFFVIEVSNRLIFKIVWLHVCGFYVGCDWIHSVLLNAQ